MPSDGWYQVAPVGEFAHTQAGLTQVVDAEACTAMANRFNEEAGIQPFDKLRADRFAGLLVDFDHFSLDGEKRSEAAGWITALENRDGGLFAKIRWSDVGESAVKGGRYRFLSPVWNRADCVDLGGGRVRPVRLLNAAVTNDPNLKGMRPLSNSGRIANSAEPRFKWELGDTPEGRHCPSCVAVAGQVHTMAEWNAAGVTPGADALYCQGSCQCQLVPTDAPSGGPVVTGPMRKITNTGWREEARTASLAVRRAKADALGDRNARLKRRQDQSMERASRDYEKIYQDKGLKGMTAEEVTYLAARISVKVRNGTKLTDAEERFVRERGLSPAAANRGRRVQVSDDRVVARGAALSVLQAKASLRGFMGNSTSAKHGDKAK